MGDVTDSLFEVFRESHEKGLVSFRDGGPGFDSLEDGAGGGAGGACHGTAGRAPDNPIKVEFTGDRIGRGGFETLSLRSQKVSTGSLH